MAEKDTVVVSYHCDTEKDSDTVNNRFSADLLPHSKLLLFLFLLLFPIITDLYTCSKSENRQRSKPGLGKLD